MRRLLKGRVLMFQFRFESLLKHRRYEEELAQKLMHEAKMDLQHEQEEFKRLKKERREGIHQLELLQTGALATHEISLSLRFIDKLSERLEQQRLRVQQAEQRAAARHQALISAVKKRKMLEKLKENERLNYQRDLMQKDLKFMDEVAVNRHIRSQS
jgi:flagellar FliJ protein